MSSLLHSEILEQPTVIRRLLDFETERVAEIGASLSRQNIRYVVIAARGTSDNAGAIRAIRLWRTERLTVALATPSLFSVYQQPPGWKARSSSAFRSRANRRTL